MEQTLTVRGKEFISARLAATKFGYESDYIGQLIRSGKIDGKLVGRSWFLNPQELKLYMENRSREGRGRKRGTKVRKAHKRQPTQIKRSLAPIDPEELPGVKDADQRVKSLWPSILEIAAKNIDSSELSLPQKNSGATVESNNANAVEAREVVRSLMPEQAASEPSATKEAEITFVTEREVASPLKEEVLKNEINIDTRKVATQTSVSQLEQETAKNSRIVELQTESHEHKETAQNISSPVILVSRIVPINYHVDHAPLMPVITKPVRADIVEKPTAHSVPVQLMAAASLNPVHHGYFRSLGRVLGAAFALSALTFGILSGFASLTMEAFGGYTHQAAAAAPRGLEAIAVTVYQALHALM